MNVILLPGISHVYAGSLPVVRIYECDTLIWQMQDVVPASEEFLTADTGTPVLETSDGNTFLVLIRN